MDQVQTYTISYRDICPRMRGKIYFKAQNSIRKSFIFARVSGPHLDRNYELHMIMISVFWRSNS